MRVIPPTTVTDAMLVSSTAPEPGAGETAWSAATNYSIGTEAIRTTTHKVYTCKVAGVDAGTPETTPLRWEETRPTNKWAMFQTDRNVQTVLASPLTVAIAPGKRINSVGIVGLESNTVTVELTIGATVHFTKTVNTLLRNTLTWTDYLFGAFRYQESIVMFDLPPITGATLTITITGGTCKCAGVFFNMNVYMGRILKGAKVDSDNFSKFERDPYGTLSTLIPKRTVPKHAYTLLVENERVETLRALKKTLNAVSALWSGLDDKKEDPRFESLLCVGVYRAFPLNFEHTEHTLVDLQLEEM